MATQLCVLRLIRLVLKNFLLLALISISVTSTLAVIKDGQVDPGLNIKPISFYLGGKVDCFVTLADGKILVCGAFSNLSAGTANSIARLNPDGTFDPTFSGDASSYVTQVFPLPNGQMLITGNFLQYGGFNRPRIARLNADGTLDTSFAPDFGSSFVQISALQPDGKIIVTGTFTAVGSLERHGVARLNSDGSLDLSFQGGAPGDRPMVYQGLVLPTGQIILAGQFSSYQGVARSGLMRLNTDGSLDTQYVPGIPTFENNIVFDISQAIDGKLYVVGDIGNADTINRLNTNGTIDSTFFTGGLNTNTSGQIYSVAAQDNGKVIFGGGFDGVRVRGTLYIRKGVFQLNSDGSADTTFGASAEGTVWALSAQNNGKTLIGGDFTTLNSTLRGGIGRLNSDSTLDTSFQGFLGNLSTIDAFCIQPDGKIVISGDFGAIGTSFHQYVARLNPDGTVDETFILDTQVKSRIYALALQADGKILAGGSSGVFGPVVKGLWRLNTDGSLDTTLNIQLSNQGSIETIVVRPSGKILVGGSFSSINGISRMSLAQLNPEGNLDAGFSVPVGGSLSTIALQPDEKILLGGSFSTVAGTPVSRLARLLADGTFDNTFNIGTGADDIVTGISVLPDNRIYVGGFFRNFNNVSRRSLLRLLPNGTIDESFKPPRIFGGVWSLVIMPDGKVVAAGELDANIDASPRQRIIRFLNDGAVDYSFDVHGLLYHGSSGRVFQIGLQPDGKILASGQIDHLNGFERTGLARLLTFAKPTPARFDYDGDGFPDISVFRPSTGIWYRRISYGSTIRTKRWGLATDLITPADFDGDFLTDIGVFRPSNGTWYWINSSDDSVSAFHFGSEEDLPTPADYDGDGKADVSVFRPSDGNWYRTNSSDGSFYAVHFGASGDEPTVGDFDGDGKSDIAVFRPSTGAWYQMYSSDGSIHGENFGFGTDVLVPADYDGDGKTDVAVFRPSDGYWYARNSSDGAFTYKIFGLADDIPAPGDFDGDGKADINVFRPSDGTWYRQNSSDGQFVAFPFGTNGDKPTMTAFRY